MAQEIVGSITVRLSASAANKRERILLKHETRKSEFSREPFSLSTIYRQIDCTLSSLAVQTVEITCHVSERFLSSANAHLQVLPLVTTLILTHRLRNGVNQAESHRQELCLFFATIRKCGGILPVLCPVVLHGVFMRSIRLLRQYSQTGDTHFLAD